MPFSLPPPKAAAADVEMSQEKPQNMPENETLEKVEAPPKVSELSSGKSQENANEQVDENKVQKPSFKRRNQAIYTAEEDEDN